MISLRKIFVSAAALMISFSISSTAIAQNKRKITVEKPDLEEIRISTLTPSSPYYFPKLMKKYESNDTTMTNDEYRHFYLGYMFQEDFDPYRVSLRQCDR